MATQKIKPTSTTAVAVWNDTSKKHEIWDGAVDVDVEIPGGMVNFDYDFVGATYPDDTTEVFQFKTGGSAGVLQATITLVYTDASKKLLLTATKT